MLVTDRQFGDAVVLAASGRIDQGSADAFRAALQPHLDRYKSRTTIVLDFAGVEYISSVGLRVLMLATKQVKSQGSAIAVAALRPVVKEIFDISRFALVLPCFPGVDDALAVLSPSSLAAYKTAAA